MAVLLFKLNRVPEEEAEAVRLLLEEHQIAFYETHAGAFGIGMAGIWLEDEAEAKRARALLADFQAEYSERARQEYRSRQERGEGEHFLHRLRRQPAKVILYLLAVALILYISTVPFFELWN